MAQLEWKETEQESLSRLFRNIDKQMERVQQLMVERNITHHDACMIVLDEGDELEVERNNFNKSLAAASV